MRRSLAIVVVLILCTGLVLAQGIDERVREASASGRTWLHWTVPATVSGGICCGSWRNSDFVRGSCTLGDDGDVSWNSDDSRADREPEHRGDVRIWVRADRGEIDRIKFVSTDCELDVADARIRGLDPVVPAESVMLLATVIERGRSIGEDAMSAIAVHADPSADDVLERQLIRGDDEIRPKAAFWLAAARGSRGAEAVIDRFADEEDGEVRQGLVFALFVAASGDADRAMVRAARRDPNAEVRKQSLFWISQRAGDRATAELERAVEDDPRSEVRQHAVFAISQLPPDRGVPLLIELAMEHKDPEVRRQAIFWLGQTDDTRATEFLISLLDREY